MDDFNLNTVKTILKIQAFTTSETLYLPHKSDNVLDHLKIYDGIFETQVITGILYGRISLVKIIVKLCINPHYFPWILKNSACERNIVIVSSDSE